MKMQSCLEFIWLNREDCVKKIRVHTRMAISLGPKITDFDKELFVIFCSQIIIRL